ncbi:hypothetical protein [Microbacterium sp. NPDC058389]|uniref:hypothetical protein n=1 Tax=Microbacterium sp. NPDC058389 TaxID=3346475 RepID=UPI003648E70D
MDGQVVTDGWPPLGLSLNSVGGNWAAYEQACYDQYHGDFRLTQPAWPVPNQRLSIRRNPEEDGRCFTYRHITTEGPVEANRTPDLARCERITWPRLILDEFATTYPTPSSERIAWWMNTRTSSRGVETNYLISLADFSYVVIVGSRPAYAMLVTAYPVEFRNRRDKLRREHDAYWANGGGRPI